jgi:glucose-1-phosphate thymidylyltransferase
MKVIILAGGFGTRTNGILNGIPKTLIAGSNGKPILYFMLKDLLQIFKSDEILIISNQLYYPAIKAFVDSEFGDLKITLISNGVLKSEDRLGALGDLLLALKNKQLKLKKAEAVLVLPSDTLYWNSFRLKAFVDFGRVNRGSFAITYRNIGCKAKIRNRFGCGVFNQNSVLIAFIEKPKEPPTSFAVPPFYIYYPAHIELLKEYQKEKGNMDSPGMILPFLLKKKQIIKGMRVGKDIIDAGTPEDIERAKEY